MLGVCSSYGHTGQCSLSTELCAMLNTPPASPLPSPHPCCRAATGRTLVRCAPSTSPTSPSPTRLTPTSGVCVCGGGGGGGLPPNNGQGWLAGVPRDMQGDACSLDAPCSGSAAALVPRAAGHRLGESVTARCLHGLGLAFSFLCQLARSPQPHLPLPPPAPFSFYDKDAPIYTMSRFLPPSKVMGAGEPPLLPLAAAAATAVLRRRSCARSLLLPLQECCSAGGMCGSARHAHSAHPGRRLLQHVWLPSHSSHPFTPLSLPPPSPCPRGGALHPGRRLHRGAGRSHPALGGGPALHHPRGALRCSH